MGIRNLLFIHGKNDVSLNSTNSVSRLVAQHAAKFAQCFGEVHLISLNEAVVDGVVCKKAEAKSGFLIKFEYLYNRHVKNVFTGSIIHAGRLKTILAPYNPEHWVIIVCRLTEYSLLQKIGNLIPVILWTHNYTADKRLENAIYRKPVANAWVFATTNLYHKFQAHLTEKGIWASCFAISYLRDNELGLPNFIENQGKEDNTVNLLFLGGDNEKKGLNKVIDSLKLLSVANPVKLFALGCKVPGAMKINDNVEIHFVGKSNRDVLKDYLNNCDIGIVPSTWYENSPTALIEMATFGLYIIASNTGGIPNIIHQSGRLVDQFDFPVAWKKALEETISNIKEIRKARAERATAYHQTYSSDEIVRNWEEVLNCIE